MSYEQMLDKAYKELPEKAKEKARFKMPSFESFIQGKETIIKNFTSVVNILRRDPEHLMKFLSKELATVTTPDDSRLVLKGRFKERELNKRLQEYAETFVLCSECGKPDTHIITEDKILFLRCEACGARAPIPVIK